MALIQENGSGVAGANSFVTAAFVTAYLTERNRVTENSWSSASNALQDAACIAATDYIEDRFRLQFLGNKEFRDIRQARATLDFTGLPLDSETVTIGSVVYTYNTALGGANSVLIAATVSASIDNLIGAVLATPDQAGIEHGTGTVANADVTAQAFFDDTMLVSAQASGTAGNSIATTETLTNGSWNFPTLNGGSDRAQGQPLSFPRVSLFDRDGIRIIGMPDQLLQATAEYAVRARSSILAPDPTLDALGGTVIRLKEKIGPLETDTEYASGTAGSGALPAYPAADRLLRDYIRSGGRLIRG